MWVLIISALSIGFLGSFHCVAMCGPIALALPIHEGSGTRKILFLLIYHFGRISVYSLLGAILAMAGKSFALIGLQQIVSVTIGVLVLLFLFFPSSWLSKYSITRPLSNLYLKLQGSFSYLFKQKNPGAMFLMGALNGLLPCGLVYLALAGALASSGVAEGAIFMAFFGSATLPVMLALSFFKNKISLGMRSKMQRVTPYLVSIMAVLMILRGLNLGIPYVSPEYHSEKEELSCCEPETKGKACCAKGEKEVMSCCKKEK
ncbi:MAG TPA: sulfite exporter TauE/SafE family protein [Bacteroidia bacterium]|nr:sulfite exporter TauE/SafE family protein [Bacteroidia bacterium]